MEVTNSNFEELLPKISEAISECTFFSMDGEFSGLNSGKSHENMFDTIEERYKLLKNESMDFLLCQFGLCTFTYISATKKYSCKAFNFYVFPRPFSRQAPNSRFLCQTSSIVFLANQGFDFNKLFHEGIPYLRRDDESRMREALEQRHNLQKELFSSPAFTSPAGAGSESTSSGTGAKSPALVPDEQKEFIDGILSKIEDFLENSMGASLDLPSCSAFQRKLIYQTGKIKFPGKIHLETRNKQGANNKDRYIVVNQVAGKDDMLLKERQRQAVEVGEIDKAVGFSKIIRMMSESGKLLVGHNMLLDLMHMLHQFIFPLPAEYNDFKEMARSMFPKILDTKLMATTHPFREVIGSTVLGDLEKILNREQFSNSADIVKFNHGFKEYKMSQEKLHEAGYDAFITGLCFIKMCNYLGTFQDPPKSVVMPSSHLVEPFLNKIYMMRIYDTPYINMTAADLVQQRDNVYHVSFPSTWKISDLFSLFSAHGYITIGWINDTSAFVGLTKNENENLVLNASCRSELYKVVPYNVFKNRNSTPLSTSRKRPFHSVDIEIPVKRVKPLNDDFMSTSLTTIPEDEEGTAEDLAQKLQPQDNQDITDESPVVKRARISFKTSPPTVVESTNKDSKTKLFKEPTNW